ncbi:glycosyltransferase family 4 protein [Phycicoccus sp. Root101]|uniref:glycosyltransferase family 4 protein n=1 Tax=Phycicoccus sp. Root101 TaxID=1736421 RepID=UPI000703B025|nr:glycosyltransferase family 4 protein [Phycicoccus sp. Root101]KQU68835.1 hypothetical protein ASC58_09145 [Phycicoccus sp. Root101]
MRTVHVVLPDIVDDPLHPSGGNTYDTKVCAALAELGWGVHRHLLPGAWPDADPAARAGLAAVLAELPDGATVLLDGLVASGTAELLVPASSRLRVVVLVHLPLGAADTVSGAVPVRTRRDAEGAVLRRAAAVVATSDWSREWLLEHYAISPQRVQVAEPGSDPAPVAPGAPGGRELLSVAAVVPAKGHEELVTALTGVRDLPWRMTCAGAVDLDPGHVRRLARRCEEEGIGDRVRFVGPQPSGRLQHTYAASDLLVHPSRLETYGLVVTEALARALPVVTTAVGGVAQALGTAPDGEVPGRLVPAGDARALTGALRDWLGDPDLRDRWRRAALGRRATLPSWTATARTVSAVLEPAALSA